MLVIISVNSIDILYSTIAIMGLNGLFINVQKSWMVCKQSNKK